ncbi:phosphate/phosphite/phosphonate ABC transporter substrate-binding protein [Phytoactinopolyspora sp. XMNu-373]|uniref:Phosphate/phosphite/phosphonate ABC transporter substrate-binding protein n=2 Tax=Phytoactinopolyspora mesophila TaxID=2650750 RepID=A0A7K3M8X3_9ACTN|nr:phosphate/phosphite/phosphonate ABC transporter substrate-binding protein [Phytoactinopolyspora mesophila]
MFAGRGCGAAAGHRTGADAGCGVASVPGELRRRWPGGGFPWRRLPCDRSAQSRRGKHRSSGGGSRACRAATSADGGEPVPHPDARGFGDRLRDPGGAQRRCTRDCRAAADDRDGRALSSDRLTGVSITNWSRSTNICGGMFTRCSRPSSVRGPEGRKPECGESGVAGASLPRAGPTSAQVGAWRAGKHRLRGRLGGTPPPVWTRDSWTSDSPVQCHSPVFAPASNILCNGSSRPRRKECLSMKITKWLAVFAAVALVAACGGDDNGNGDDAGATTDDNGEAEAGADWPDEIVLVFTPSREAQQLVDDAGPLAEMIEERVDISVDPFVATDYAGVIVALEAGQAGIAGGLGPQQMVQAEAQAGADLILQSERFGDVQYVTQWFTNDPDTYCETDPVDVDGFLFCNGVEDATGPGDGPIGEAAIAQVEGEPVAFVDQGSASGHLVPSLQLFEAGIDPQTGVEAIFAGGHDNAVLAVYRGDAAVGVSFNDARGEVVDQFEDVGEEVVVFAWSPPIPNDGFAVAGDLPEDLKEALADALIDIAATDEGHQLLNDLYNIDDLVPVDSAAYDPIRTLVSELGELLEN